jgi:hypothetical protein
MRGKIISIRRSKPGFYCRDLNITFPVVHRVTGKVWTTEAMTESVGRFVYLLGDADDKNTGLAKVTEDTPILRPVRGIDTLWTMVRHHRIRDFAEGYLDALLDLRNVETREQTWVSLWETPDGIFTIARCRPFAPGRIEPLIAYHWQAPLLSGPMAGDWDWRSYVVGPDGPIDSSEISQLEEHMVFVFD